MTYVTLILFKTIFDGRNMIDAINYVFNYAFLFKGLVGQQVTHHTCIYKNKIISRLLSIIYYFVESSKHLSLKFGYFRLFTCTYNLKALLSNAIKVVFK